MSLAQNQKDSVSFKGVSIRVQSMGCNTSKLTVLNLLTDLFESMVTLSEQGKMKFRLTARDSRDRVHIIPKQNPHKILTVNPDELYVSGTIERNEGEIDPTKQTRNPSQEFDKRVSEALEQLGLKENNRDFVVIDDNQQRKQAENCLRGQE